jgi:hypothetical protein
MATTMPRTNHNIAQNDFSVERDLSLEIFSPLSRESSLAMPGVAEVGRL